MLFSLGSHLRITLLGIMKSVLIILFAASVCGLSWKTVMEGRARVETCGQVVGLSFNSSIIHYIVEMTVSVSDGYFLCFPFVSFFI